MKRTICLVLLAGMIGCSDQSGKDETHEADTQSDSDTGDTGTADSSDSTTESVQKVDANGIPVFENCPVEQAADACADGWCRIESGTLPKRDSEELPDVSDPPQARRNNVNPRVF